jgi:hypothetical protein
MAKKQKRTSADRKTKEPPVRARTIYLTDEEWKALGHQAVEEGTRFTAVARAAIRKYLGLG